MRQHMLKTSALLLIGMGACNTHASSVTQVNRYATVLNKPSSAQVNPLLAVQQMRFPPEIKTVGDAMKYWLRYSGFSLAPSDKQPESLQSIMNLPLPLVHRNLGPLTVLDGLEVLAGQSLFSLVNDCFHREVNFRLKVNSPKKIRGKA